jgi:hypothetical protein
MRILSDRGVVSREFGGDPENDPSENEITLRENRQRADGRWYRFGRPTHSIPGPMYRSTYRMADFASGQS